MADVLKSDIFFVVSTFAVLVVAVGICVVLIYAIQILRDARKLSKAVKEEGEEILEDVRTVRSSLKGRIMRTLKRSPKRTRSQKDN